MSRLTLTRSASADLKSIAAYTQRKWGREQRQLYLRQFDDGFIYWHLLADTPALGNNCDYIKRGYQKFPVGSHLVFYRDDGPSAIQIVRILHKRMDAKAQLTGQ